MISPGVVVAVQSVSLLKAPEGAPAALIVDAAKVNPAAKPGKRK
jgi:hypothetical protein